MNTLPELPVDILSLMNSPQSKCPRKKVYHPSQRQHPVKGQILPRAILLGQNVHGSCLLHTKWLQSVAALLQKQVTRRLPFTIVFLVLQASGHLVRLPVNFLSCNTALLHHRVATQCSCSHTKKSAALIRMKHKYLIARV